MSIKIKSTAGNFGGVLLLIILAFIFQANAQTTESLIETTAIIVIVCGGEREEFTRKYFHTSGFY